jgi:uncharacterized OB-fold protein
VDTLEYIPVAESLFKWAGATAHLIGSRCTGCGTHYFPKTLSCRNPHCAAKQIEEALLGPRGRIYSYTAQAYRPPPLFKMEPWNPYVIVSVELPEGLRVMGMLTDTPATDIHIGMDVELIAQLLYRDEEGRGVMTYKFKPMHTGNPVA